MPLCSNCSAVLEPHNLIEAAADKLLPPELELYDFGGGNMVAPMPDLPKDNYVGGRYLTSFIAGLNEKKRTADCKFLLFHISGDWRTGEPSFIEDDIKRAIAAFPTKAKHAGETIEIV